MHGFRFDMILFWRDVLWTTDMA